MVFVNDVDDDGLVWDGIVNSINKCSMMCCCCCVSESITGWGAVRMRFVGVVVL